MKNIFFTIISLFICFSCNNYQQSNRNTKQDNTLIQSIDYCDYQIINRDDGVIVTHFPTIPIASDNLLETGISLSSNGQDNFVSTIIRFYGSASKLIGNLTIRFENSNMLTFKLVNSGLSYIENSETAIGIFSINENQYNDLKNSDLLTVSFMLEDSLIHTLECKQNKSVLKEQMKCISEMKLKSFNNFYSKNYNYEMFYPKDFQLIKGTGANTDLKAQKDDGSSIIVAVYPRTNEEFSITAHDYTKELIEQQFQQQNINHSIIKSQKLYIDKYEAFLINYISPENRTKAIEIYFYKEKFAFVITATAKDNVFNQYEPVFLKCLYSLKFK